MPLDAGKSEAVIICRQCGTAFKKGPKDKPYRKFCTRKCYRESRRKFESVPYPMIWHEGRRQYLHRVIYMEHTGERLTPKDIVHHKDHNPFNRDFSNLERLAGASAHWYMHHVRPNAVPESTEDFREFGF